jgi:hypothetical protein
MISTGLPETQRVDTRPYWIGVALVVIALLAASVLVAAQGSHANVRARRLTPTPDSVVSVRPDIRVLFARAVDKGSVEGAVRILPEVPFDLSWTADNEVRILPRAALRAESLYIVTIGPGIRDLSGESLSGQLQ